MPSGAIHEQRGVRAPGDMARDFIEMKLHHVGVGVRKRQRRALAFRRADRAEEIGVFIALIGGLAWARSTTRPLPHDAVLLADAGFILEPDFDGRLRRQMSKMRVQRCFEVFLKASTIPAFCAG